MPVEALQKQPRTNNQLRASAIGVSVAVAGLTTLLEVNVADLDQVCFEVAPVTNPLDAFEVQARIHPDGSYVRVAGAAAADFTTPKRPVLAASGDLTALVAGTSGWCMLDVRGFYGLRLQASAGVGVSTVSAYLNGRT